MPVSIKSLRDGFSVIEVMMATTILLVGFVGVIQAITIGSESVDTARKQYLAHQVITAEIEKLRGSAWTTLANLPASATITISPSGTVSGDSSSFALSAAGSSTSLATLARGFTCSFTRTRLRPTAATASTVTFVKVVYAVSWTSNTGRAHSYTMESYFGMNGLHLSHQQS
jgi:Tfp pilus assembly protein PilV